VGVDPLDPSVSSTWVTIIEPPSGWSHLGLGELWKHRDLLYFLAWRDIKVRYAQSAIGVAWAVLQPLMMMVIFSVFLGRLAEVPSDGIPYPVFALAGLVPWTYFSNAVASATESLVASSNLVSKVYFPRLVVPLAALLSWLPDLAIASVLVVGLMLIYGITPSATIVLLPLFGLFAVLAAASVSTWLSALNVSYRDVRYAVPFILQLWLFATPVVYPASLVPERWRPLFGLNPMAGVVEGFRWALLRSKAPSWGLMTVSLVVTLLLFVGGAFWFRRVEHRFADVI
jgi:lipopolysaccharide transport system permease protein